MRKFTDYLAAAMADCGVRHIFMLAGGWAMHLNDSFGLRPDLNCFYSHHEQACEIAAQGYARLTGKIAVINVTTGAGRIKVLTESASLGSLTARFP
jgi:acetolactate synthase I/II/III large subunit